MPTLSAWGYFQKAADNRLHKKLISLIASVLVLFSEDPGQKILIIILLL